MADLDPPGAGLKDTISASTSVAPNPIPFIGFGDLRGPKPCKFIGFGDLRRPKTYKFIGFVGRAAPQNWSPVCCDQDAPRRMQGDVRPAPGGWTGGEGDRPALWYWVPDGTGYIYIYM